MNLLVTYITITRVWRQGKLVFTSKCFLVLEVDFDVLIEVAEGICSLNFITVRLCSCGVEINISLGVSILVACRQLVVWTTTKSEEGRGSLIMNSWL